MKLFKYAVIILAVAIITDYAIVLAYSSPSGVGILTDLVKNEGQHTEYYEKTNWEYQTYEHKASMTVLTNPCPNCKVAARLETENGDLSPSIVTVTGNTKRFDENTGFASPNIYRLYFWREDFTLLNTHHSGEWMINPYN